MVHAANHEGWKDEQTEGKTGRGINDTVSAVLKHKSQNNGRSHQNVGQTVSCRAAKLGCRVSRSQHAVRKNVCGLVCNSLQVARSPKSKSAFIECNFALRHLK